MKRFDAEANTFQHEIPALFLAAFNLSLVLHKLIDRYLQSTNLFWVLTSNKFLYDRFFFEK